jgi:hypothetical protein
VVAAMTAVAADAAMLRGGDGVTTDAVADELAEKSSNINGSKYKQHFNKVKNNNVFVCAVGNGRRIHK